VSEPAGCRLSWRDGLVTGIAITAVVWLWPRSALAGSLIAVVVGHFLLFCNVFRVPTRLELAWSAVFLLNVLGSSLFEALIWPRYLFLQLPVTVVVLVMAMRLPGYHGVLWRRINLPATGRHCD
jgi:hypothetical protein